MGKTAIAEGLARAIAQRASVGGAPLPAFLLGKRVMSLDVGLLMAGAKARRWGRRGHVCVWISDETQGVAERAGSWWCYWSTGSRLASHASQPARASRPTPLSSTTQPLNRAQERGELESRVTKLLAECQADGNVILVIDEIHTLVG